MELDIEQLFIETCQLILHFESWTGANLEHQTPESSILAKYIEISIIIYLMERKSTAPVCCHLMLFYFEVLTDLYLISHSGMSKEF